MIVLGLDWASINSGQLIIAVAILSAVFAIYRSSPLGADAVESWKHLAEGRKLELDVAVADAQRRFDQLEAEKARSQELKIQLAKCQEQPKTEELAGAVKLLAASFDAAAVASSKEFAAHRGELISIMSRLAEGQTRDRETLGSMHQALVVLVDRQRSNRVGDAEGRDPPLST